MMLRRRWHAFGLAAMLGLSGACGAPAVNDVAPAGPAMEPRRVVAGWATSLLDRFLEFNAWIGTHSGYVAMFARDGEVVHAKVAGYADIEAERPMQPGTRFRMASMTKPVTAVAALILVEEGRLGLDDPVSRYVPTAATLRVATSEHRDASGGIPTEPIAEPLTVRHLLTFSSGIGAEEGTTDLGRIWAENHIYDGSGTLEQRVDRILGAPLFEQPGTKWRYGWSADVLARVVEVAAGAPFDDFLERRIFKPLGMASTSFLPPEDERADIATMYTQDANGDLTRVERPASDAPDWTPGGSGLVSTAGDYMRFALMLWNRGSYAGARILSEASVEVMTTPHVTSGVLVEEGIEGLGWGLGLAVVVDSEATPTLDRDGDFWWSGYYGTTFFVSPATGLVGVVLSQNQPSEHSGIPYAVFLAQTFPFLGL